MQEKISSMLHSLCLTEEQYQSLSTSYHHAIRDWAFFLSTDSISSSPSFKECLFKAIVKADLENLRKLGMAFPVEVNIFHRYSQGRWLHEPITSVR